MAYKIYKLKFNTSVHFGINSLKNSDFTIQSDTLFSALFMEAIKCEKEKMFYESCKNGDILFSNAFPYKEEKGSTTYYLPKPIIINKDKEKEQKLKDENDKKVVKKIKYLPISAFKKFANMQCDSNELKNLKEEKFAKEDLRTFASIRNDEGETKPYFVRTYTFYENVGLYIILQYKNDENLKLFNDLIEKLSYTGIGGKKNISLGKFEIVKVDKKNVENFANLLATESSRYMLISTSMANDTELSDIISGANYLLQKRSGFIDSEKYSDTFRKKKNMYFFAVGSTFDKKYEGDIFDVSEASGEFGHPVYRYGKSLFVGV